MKALNITNRDGQNIKDITSHIHKTYAVQEIQLQHIRLNDTAVRELNELIKRSDNELRSLSLKHSGCYVGSEIKPLGPQEQKLASSIFETIQHSFAEQPGAPLQTLDVRGFEMGRALWEKVKSTIKMCPSIRQLAVDEKTFQEGLDFESEYGEVEKILSQRRQISCSVPHLFDLVNQRLFRDAAIHSMDMDLLKLLLSLDGLNEVNIELADIEVRFKLDMAEQSLAYEKEILEVKKLVDRIPLVNAIDSIEQIQSHYREKTIQYLNQERIAIIWWNHQILVDKRHAEPGQIVEAVESFLAHYEERYFNDEAFIVSHLSPGDLKKHCNDEAKRLKDKEENLAIKKTYFEKHSEEIKKQTKAREEQFKKLIAKDRLPTEFDFLKNDELTIQKFLGTAVCGFDEKNVLLNKAVNAKLTEAVAILLKAGADPLAPVSEEELLEKSILTQITSGSCPSDICELVLSHLRQDMNVIYPNVVALEMTNEEQFLNQVKGALVDYLEVLLGRMEWPVWVRKLLLIEKRLEERKANLSQYFDGIKEIHQYPSVNQIQEVLQSLKVLSQSASRGLLKRSKLHDSVAKLLDGFVSSVNEGEYGTQRALEAGLASQQARAELVQAAHLAQGQIGQAEVRELMEERRRRIAAEQLVERLQLQLNQHNPDGEAAGPAEEANAEAATEAAQPNAQAEEGAAAAAGPAASAASFFNPNAQARLNIQQLPDSEDESEGDEDNDNYAAGPN